MSNSEFPGQSWQEGSAFPGEPSYRAGTRDGLTGNGYAGNGRHGDGWADAGGNVYAGNGRNGAGSAAGDDIGRGFTKGYRGGSRGRRGVRRRGAGALNGANGRGTATGLIGPADPYDPDNLDTLYRPAGPYGPTRPIGPGRFGIGRGARNLRGPVGPIRPRQRPPGNFLQRQWRGRWWRHWTLKKAAGVMGGLVVGVVLILIAGFFVVYSSVALPSALLNKTFDQASTVYFANGQEVGCFCTVNRTVLTEDQYKKSKYLIAAVTAAEDRNFFNEGGISITGILRALKNNLSGGNVQGGSTITEQYVKTYLDPSGLGNLTYKEKLKEVILAIKLAKKESKWWIITHYLNSIYFGASAWGAEAAAQTYFGIDAWNLSIGQAAMIAAMIQNPSGYDPTQPNQVVSGLGNSLAGRWQGEVLANMVRDGAITQQQASAQKFPKVSISPPDSNWTGYNGYIMNLVQNELQAYYGIQPSQIGSLGLRIHTTISQRLMNALYSTVGQIKSQIGAMPSYVRIAAVLEKPGTGQIKAFYGGPGFGIKHCKRFGCDNITIISPSQVGSSFKPYVLATAVSQGMNSQTSILNSHSPLCIPPADNTEAQRLQLSKQTLVGCQSSLGYYPLNQPGENTPGRNLTVPYATASSNNAAYEDLIHRTGVNNVINMARQLGVYSGTIAGLKKLFWSPSGAFPGAVIAALGSGNLTAVDQANTFATLVSGGVSVTPHIIDYVVSSNGQKLPSTGMVNNAHAVSPDVAADTDYALSFDTNPSYSGTGVPNAMWQASRPMIAKTGTLGNGAQSSAAWFIGAIPQYSMSVAFFTDQPNKQFLDGLPSVGPWTGGYGGAWPAHLWQTFMSQQFSNLPVRQLPTPNFNPPTFTKWIQARPVKKQNKCGQGPGGNGPGGGNGHGHHHGHGLFGTLQVVALRPCPGQSKGPNPSPSSTGPSPSNSASPTPSSSSPSPTGRPSPSTTRGAATNATHVTTSAPRRQRHQSSGTPSLTAAAVLTLPLLRRPGWVVTTSGAV